MKTKLDPNWLFIAVRGGQTTVEIPAEMMEMTVVRCKKCNDAYSIRHSRPFLKPELAKEQAEKLAAILIEHHQNDIEHVDVYWIP